MFGSINSQFLTRNDQIATEEETIPTCFQLIDDQMMNSVSLLTNFDSRSIFPASIKQSVFGLDTDCYFHVSTTYGGFEVATYNDNTVMFW